MNNILETQIADYVAAYKTMGTASYAPTGATRTLSDGEKEIFEEAIKAWTSYSASEAGQIQLNALPSMDLPTAAATVSGILDSSDFAKLKQLLESINLIPRSFSIGLNFEAELIIGITGTIGAAVGVGESKGVQSSEFLSVGLEEGIEAGALTGVQFGLWDSVPSDLGGYAWGTEVDLGFEVEGSGAIYYSTKGEILGVTLTVGAGVDDGIAESESYTFILGDQGSGSAPFIKPAYQPRKANLLILESIYCKTPVGDGIGNANEIFFTFQADNAGKVYPYPTYDYFSMQAGDTWNCGRSVWFDDNVVVAVYDSDGTSGNDYLFSFGYTVADFSTYGSNGVMTIPYATPNDKNGYFTVTSKLVATGLSS